MEPRLVLSVVPVHAGDSLQAAIDHAQPGDTLILDAGATFSGPISLPNKTGDQWITIQSSALDHLPAPGQRVGPDDAAFMPKITSPGSGEAALGTAPGAHNFRFVGIEFMPATQNAFIYDLIDFGDGSSAQNSLSQVPHDLTLDQCYVHAWLDQPLKRGIALNSANTSIVNSYIAGFKVDGQDSQAIAGWNGPGPFKIDNNYVEAAGENILFGGAATSINGLIPSDIEIRDNLISKPLAWNQNDPTTYAGTHWSVKNLLELKNAQRVTIDGNRFEHNWADGQVGFAVVFTPRGDQSGGPWVTVSNVTFTNNVVTQTAQGINILGSDDYSKSQVATNIVVRNNLFTDLGDDRWGKGAGGRVFQMLPGQAGGSKGVVIDHNTITSAYTIVAAEGTHSGFVFTNNIAPNGAYGIFAGGVGSGTAALNAAFPGYTFQGNVLVGADSRYYPANNTYPSSWNAVGFVNFTGGDYHLTASSTIKATGTSSSDPGANVDAITAAETQSGPTTPKTPAAASHLVFGSFPATVTAGTSSTFTITATDANGNAVTGYHGTVHFSSSDSQAGLPGDYTFTAADNGVHTFSVTLKSAGTRSLTAADAANGITGTQAAITVSPAAASGLVLAGFPNSVVAGNAASFSVTATDPYGNAATGYRGTVNFSSSDSQAVLPGSYTFAAADNGTHTFSATLKTAGSFSLTASDATASSISGTQASINVKAILPSHAIVQVTGTQVQATTGKTFTGLVATITNTDATATTASFTATVDWGDGTTSAGTISVDSKGGFDVNGSNTYTRSGSFTITVTVHDQNNAVVGKALTQGSVSPAQEVVVGRGTQLWATAGTEFSGMVATFSDSRSTAAAGDFTVGIVWGDGAVTPGTVTSDGKGGFAVEGNHTYTNAHQTPGGLQFFVINVFIRDVPGGVTGAAFTVAKVVAGPTITTSAAPAHSGNTAAVPSVSATSASPTTQATSSAQAPAATTTVASSHPSGTSATFQASVAAPNTGTATVAAPAHQPTQATTSVVSSGTTAANGPPASVGNATPSTQAVPLTVTPGAAKTPQQSNGNSGTNPTAASAYSLLRMQELADMGTMFWLDHK